MSLPSDSSGRERELRREIRQLLAELELVSHGSTTSFDPTGGGHGFGPTEGRVPGGLRRDGDDHEWFRRRFVGAVSVRALEGLLQDLKEALAHARKSPTPTNPEYGSFAWKRMIAESETPTKKLADDWRVSERYIRKIRLDYRDPNAPVAVRADGRVCHSYGPTSSRSNESTDDGAK